MTLTKKEILKLRSLAQTMKPMFQIGKDGLTEAVERQIINNLLAHELGKLAVLPSCPLDLPSIEEILNEFGIITVQMIGRNIVVYKPNPKLEPKDRVL